jgi:hypothetical protein
MLATLNTRIPLGAGGIPFLPATFSTTLDAIDSLKNISVQPNVLNNENIVSYAPPPPIGYGDYPKPMDVVNDTILPVNEEILKDSDKINYKEPAKNINSILIFGAIALLFIFKNKK